jgi:hypothetical protein
MKIPFNSHHSAMPRAQEGSLRPVGGIFLPGTGGVLPLHAHISSSDPTGVFVCDPALGTLPVRLGTVWLVEHLADVCASVSFKGSRS